jgi:glycosyltransferase involved in cell wall biosynthesis
VVAWPEPHKKVAQLENAGVSVYQRPGEYKYPLWRKVLRVALRQKRPVMITDLERWLRQDPPAFVVVNHTMVMPHYDLMEMLIENGWPFLTVTHVSSDYWWAEDADALRYQRAIDKAQKCYFVSTATLDMVRKQIGIDVRKAAIVRNPVSVDRTARHPWPSTPATERLEMACVGRLDPRSKGQDLMFDVLSKPRWLERSWHLNLYGSGRFRNRLEEMMRERGLEGRVSFCGHRPIEDIWAVNHVLVQPSRAEGLPITIVEAMLCSRPVMTTDVGGSAELIDDNVTGFVADAPTVKQIDEAMERLWARRGDLAAIGERPQRADDRPRSGTAGADWV